MSEYEKKSLRLQLIGLIVEAIGLAGAIASLWFLIAQVNEQVKATNLQVDAIKVQNQSTKAQYEALDASVYQDLMSKQLDLDKLLIEKPQLYRHIFGKRKIPANKLPEALSAASYYVDFFQLVYNQRTRKWCCEGGQQNRK